MKTWPGDAIVIMASRRGTAIEANMLAVVRTCCRDCGAPIDADAHSVGVAAASPARQGRPIDFLCIECGVTYDRGSIDMLVDDRRSARGAT